MNILSLYTGQHDACAAIYHDYDLVAALAEERMSRIKIDGGKIPYAAIKECLAIAKLEPSDIDVLTLGNGIFPSELYRHFPLHRRIERFVRKKVNKLKHKSLERELMRYQHIDGKMLLDQSKLLKLIGLKQDTEVYFYNHHEAHALPSLFHTDWQEALLYTADGGGDNVQYSQRLFKNNNLSLIGGGPACLLEPNQIDSVGLAYGFATQCLGFKMNRHEGKLTGLAAWGKPIYLSKIENEFQVDSNGIIHSSFNNYKAMRAFFFQLFEGAEKQDVACSIQLFLENIIVDAVAKLLRQHGVSCLGLSGGVFANVRLNQKLAEELCLQEIFIYPCMSDQGLAAGGALAYLLKRDGLKTWLQNRYRLEHLYFGRNYNDSLDKLMQAEAGVKTVSSNVVEDSAALIHSGKVIAIYTKAMEYGPRALGARSIIAAANNAAINDELNQRLSRTEFMPFAPVIANEDVDKVFELNENSRYAAKFMTITCKVKSQWREKIPAVVHVDKTARPQIIERKHNPLYYDILQAYKNISGLPVLINTSFNVHEEPIVNTPTECLQALLEDRVDYVVSDNYLYQKQPDS